MSTLEQKQIDSLVFDYLSSRNQKVAQMVKKELNAEPLPPGSNKLTELLNLCDSLHKAMSSIAGKRSLASTENENGTAKKAKKDSVQKVLDNLADKKMVTVKTKVNQASNKDSSDSSSDEDEPPKAKVNTLAVKPSPVKPLIKSPVKQAPTPVAKKNESSEESSDDSSEDEPAVKTDKKKEEPKGKPLTPAVKTYGKPVATPTAQKKASSDSDSSDSDDSDDDDKPALPKTPKTSAAKPVAVAPAKTPVKTPAKKKADSGSDSDDSDDSSEDETAKKVTKKEEPPKGKAAKAATPAASKSVKTTVTPAAKKKDESSDSSSDDDSSEDEKPAPAKTPVKTPAKTPAKDSKIKENGKPASTPVTKKDASESESDSDSSEEDVPAKQTFALKDGKLTPKPDSQQSQPQSAKRKTSPFRRVKADTPTGGDGSFKITPKSHSNFIELKGKNFKKEKTKKKKGFNSM